MKKMLEKMMAVVAAGCMLFAANAAVLAEENGVRMAFELKMATAGTVLTENGEAAFFPPVTGG